MFEKCRSIHGLGNKAKLFSNRIIIYLLNTFFIIFFFTFYVHRFHIFSFPISELHPNEHGQFNTFVNSFFLCSLPPHLFLSGLHPIPQRATHLSFSSIESILFTMEVFSLAFLHLIYFDALPIEPIPFRFNPQNTQC